MQWFSERCRAVVAVAVAANGDAHVTPFELRADGRTDGKVFDSSSSEAEAEARLATKVRRSWWRTTG